MKYSNPKVDALLEQARATYDVVTCKKRYGAAQQLIVTDLPIVPLSFGAEYAALRNTVHGFEWIPDQIPRFREVWRSAS